MNYFFVLLRQYGNHKFFSDLNKFYEPKYMIHYTFYFSYHGDKIPHKSNKRMADLFFFSDCGFISHWKRCHGGLRDDCSQYVSSQKAE